MLRIGKFELENTSKDYSHSWFHLLPGISIQHKYWYSWRINIYWLLFDFMLEITKINWLGNSKLDDEVYIYCRKGTSPITKLTVENAAKFTGISPHLILSICNSNRLINLFKHNWTFSDTEEGIANNLKKRKEVFDKFPILKLIIGE